MGERWNTDGSKRVPAIVRERCVKCSAYRDAPVNDHQQKEGVWRVEHPADPCHADKVAP